MKTDPQFEKLSEQIQELIDGTISRANFESLSMQLASDPAAREHYAAHLEVESLLEERLQVESVSSSSVLPKLGELNAFRKAFLAIAACLAALLGFCNLMLIPEPVTAVTAVRVELNFDVPASQVLRQSVARLTNGSNFQLDSGGWSPSLGSRLAAGSYELSEGSIELTFDAGTKVHLVAPARFGVVDFDEIDLRSGKLEADVPEQAIGFRVRTPAGEIVDYSTKFSVDVDKSGRSDVHVLEGLVEAIPNLVDQRPIPLVENSSLRMSPDSVPEEVDFVPSSVVEFAARKSGDSAYSYMHFSFDEELTNGLVKNHGNSGNGQGGELVSEEKDAWLQVSGKVGKAIFFSGKSAEIKTNVKGVSGNHPRTIAFWTRIMPGTHARNSYSFMGWGSPEKQNGGKWQMGWNPNYAGSDGTEGAIRTEFGGGYVVGSTDLRDGKWHHVASVFIGGNGSAVQQVRHYVDGKLESVSGFKDQRIDTDANQETLSVGKYIFSGSPFFGSFKGWLDEMYLFDTALTPSQIVEIMNNSSVPAADEIVPIIDEF